MTFLKMHYREDYWFVGGLLLALVLGVIAGLTLAIVFLAACTVLFVACWFVVILYAAIGRPGAFAVWLACAIPILVVATWMTVVAAVWGIVR
jgi:hypothetical protein